MGVKSLLLLSKYCLALLIFFFLAKPAHAYIDPGTGSLILQMLIAGLLGASFAVKIHWRKIRAFLINLTRGGKKDTVDGGE